MAGSSSVRLAKLTMSNTNSAELDNIQAQLQDRMVRSGEWTRIQRSLHIKLNEIGWLDQVKGHAKETATTQDPLNFAVLQEDVQTFALDTLPPHIRQDVLKEIQAYVQSQIQRG